MINILHVAFGSHILISEQRSYTSVALYVFSIAYWYALIPVTAEINNRYLARLIDELPVAFFFIDNSYSRCENKLNTLVSGMVWRNSELYQTFTLESTGNTKEMSVEEYYLLNYLSATRYENGLLSFLKSQFSEHFNKVFITQKMLLPPLNLEILKIC